MLPEFEQYGQQIRVEIWPGFQAVIDAETTFHSCRPIKHRSDFCRCLVVPYNWVVRQISDGLGGWVGNSDEFELNQLTNLAVVAFENFPVGS